MKQKKGAKTQADIDWENRVLCGDESCIGLVGPGGRCRECGLAFGASVPTADTTEDVGHDPAAEDDEPDISTGEVEVADDQDDTGWENRILCSDGSCIGVIGPDGRCKECGLPRDSAAS